MPIPLVPLVQADPDAIEALLDAAFGRDRRGRTAYRLREGTAWLPELSFAAFDGALLVGTLQSWPVALSGHPLVLVGPVAVLPERQGAGIGSTLMTAAAAALDRTPSVMIGDPDYYRRWGYSAAATACWRVPGPVERDRLLARAAGPLPATGLLAPRALAEPQLAA